MLANEKNFIGGEMFFAKVKRYFELFSRFTNGYRMRNSLSIRGRLNLGGLSPTWNLSLGTVGTFGIDMPTLAGSFTSQGYFLAKDALSASDIKDFKAVFAAIRRARFSQVDKFAFADFVNKSIDAHHIPVNCSILRQISMILGDTFAWVPQADMYLNVCTAMHRDNPCRDQVFTGEDWDESESKYGVIRVATYLTTSAACGSQFIVSPRSHIGKGLGYELLDLNAGDLLLFDPRILHGSTGARSEKQAMFLCYGKNNAHTERTIRWLYRERSQDLGYSPLNRTLSDALRSHQLLFETDKP